MNQHRGEGFKEFQRETYDRLYSDLDFALYKVQHPFRTYFEHHVVSLAVKRIEGIDKMSFLAIGCGRV